jgi:transposase
MMGQSDPQRAFFYNISLETFVPPDHPLRAIRPLIDDRAIRRHCRDLYAPIGRPSIPPEQLFLALVGGYLLGVTSDRKLVVELQCNMALRWFVGLNLDQQPWDASTFSQNRRRRFDESGVLERLFDETVKRAMACGATTAAIPTGRPIPAIALSTSGARSEATPRIARSPIPTVGLCPRAPPAPAPIRGTP